MEFLWILFIQGTNCLTLEEDYHIFWYRSVLQWSKIKANQKCTKMYGHNRHHENNFQFRVSKNLAQTSTWRTKSVTCLHPCSRDLETCLLSITEEDVIDNRHRYISQLEPGLINTITMPQSKDCAPFSWALNSPGKPPFLAKGQTQIKHVFQQHWHVTQQDQHMKQQDQHGFIEVNKHM
jgi:hypothetical protein